jgi:hypothetical protein
MEFLMARHYAYLHLALFFLCCGALSAQPPNDAKPEDPPRMPNYGRDKAPEPRSRKEVNAILAGAPDPAEKIRKLQIVLVSGRKDHGPGEHDYPAWQKTWARLLGMADQLTVGTADDWPTADQFEIANVLVFYQHGKWTPDRARDMDAFLGRGGGAVYIHYAVDGSQDAPGFAQRIGLVWKDGRSKYRHGALELGFETGGKHPIARNFDKMPFYDESYWRPGKKTTKTSRCSGRLNPLRAGCSSRFPATSRGVLTTHCSEFFCYGESPGRQRNPWTGSMIWSCRGRE